MSKRVKRKKPPTVPPDYRPPPDPPTAEQRIKALEAKLAALEATVASHRNALDVYPALADWTVKVETDLKKLSNWAEAVSKDLTNLVENDRKLLNSLQYHTHPGIIFIR